MFTDVTSRLGAALLVAASAATACSNGSTAALMQQAEAHRLASHLRVQFSRAAEASNRAVMADTDEASSAAARDAERATLDVTRDMDQLQPLLGDLGYMDETRELAAFKGLFAQYRALDADILPLAVENTNIKAQRLAFGPAHEAVAVFRRALAGLAKPGAGRNGCCEALVAQATAAVLEVQVMETRHIAESDEAEMSKMEAAMAASAGVARQALATMKGQVSAAAISQIDEATTALDRLVAVNADIVSLSRRNSNVRSLALSLGKKRTVTAQADDALQALEDALAKHHFAATR